MVFAVWLPTEDVSHAEDHVPPYCLSTQAAIHLSTMGTRHYWTLLAWVNALIHSRRSVYFSAAVLPVGIYLRIAMFDFQPQLLALRYHLDNVSDTGISNSLCKQVLLTFSLYAVLTTVMVKSVCFY